MWRSIWHQSMEKNLPQQHLNWTTPWLWCKMLGKFLYLLDVEWDHVDNHFVPVCSNLVLSLQLVEKLSAKAPDGSIKLKILSAIAEEHNIKWEPKSFGDNVTKASQDLLVGFVYSGFSLVYFDKKSRYYSLSFWHYLYAKVGPSTLQKPAYVEPFKSMFHHLFMMKSVLQIHVLPHNLNQCMMHIQVHLSRECKWWNACLILKPDLQVLF